MADYYSKARELGNELLKSDEYLRFKAAWEQYSQNTAGDTSNIAGSASTGKFSQNTANPSNSETLPAQELYLTQTQNEFNEIIEKTMDILKATISKEIPDIISGETNGGEGKCAKCGMCGKTAGKS
ncbi:MAG: YlbF family regulator [Clostridiales bacterium]|jgi:hypothetical protein|nr:YlbF family regulator [Clostridiales bacterium]